MTVTRASFLTEHPEWDDAPTDIVDAKLASAKLMLDSSVLGDLYDTAVTMKTCQLLARHPHARDMKLVDKDGKTVYDDEFIELIQYKGVLNRPLPI